MVRYLLPVSFLGVALVSGLAVTARYLSQHERNVTTGPQTVTPVAGRETDPPPDPIVVARASTDRSDSTPRSTSGEVGPEAKPSSPADSRPAKAETTSLLDTMFKPSPRTASRSGGNPDPSTSTTADQAATKTAIPAPSSRANPTKPEDPPPPKRNWRGLAVVIPVTRALDPAELADSPPDQVTKALLVDWPENVKAWWMGSDGKLTPYIREISVKDPDRIAPFPRGTPVEGLLKVASAELTRQGFAVDGEAIECVLLWSAAEPPRPPAPSSKPPVGWSMIWMSPAATPNSALETYFGRNRDGSVLRFFALNDPPQNVASLLSQMVRVPRSAMP